MCSTTATQLVQTVGLHSFAASCWWVDIWWLCRWLRQDSLIKTCCYLCHLVVFSRASIVAVEVAVFPSFCCQSTALVQTEIAQQLLDGFCTDINDPQRMNPNVFDVLQTFSRAPLADQSFPQISFPVVPPWSWHLRFWMKFLVKYLIDCHEMLLIYVPFRMHRSLWWSSGF